MAIRQIAAPIVLMRPDSMPAVDAWLEVDPGPHPDFVIVDEPGWASRVRRNRIAAFVMYLVWLRRAKGVARRIVSSRQIDLVHHVTYSPYWLPTPAVDLGVPSIVGPVGGAVTAPKALVALLGPRGRATEWIDRWSVRVLERVPATRRTWRSASIQIVQNAETFSRIERFTKRRPIVLNHALFHHVESPGGEPSLDEEDYVIWLSPMDSRKGPELAVRALAEADPSVRLVMVGAGPELDRMRRLTALLKVDDRIELVGRVDHDTALDLISRARVAVFTGLREEGGLALAEALYLGTPTIVLDLGGPSVIAREVVDPTQVTLIATRTQKQTIEDLAEAMSLPAQVRTGDRSPLIDRAAVTRVLSGIYADVRPRPSPGPIVSPSRPPALEPQPGDPTVSVVMPAYNAEPFIAQSIESILNQTLENLELIIVEDGSSDGTWAIIEDYAARDPRITALRNPSNIGIALSLNRGIAEARALLIGRLDADDVAVSDRFEKQLAMMASHPGMVVVGSNALHFNEQNKVLGLSMAGPTSVEDFYRLRLAGEITMVLDGTAMFRRDVFVQVGGYDPAMDAAPEVDLYSRMAELGEIVAIEEPLIRYRLYTGSNVTRSFFEGRVVHRYVAVREKARIAGNSMPSFDEFRAAEAAAPAWRRAKNYLKDNGQARYRTAGVQFANGKTAAGASNLVSALVVSPRFVVTRLWQRRISPSARRRIHDG